MIRKNLDDRIMTLKQNKQKKAEGGSKREPADLRLEKDMSELSLESTTCTLHLEKDNLREFDLTLKPIEGFYKGHEFRFHVSVPGSYPHEPPKCTCHTKVWHPNIDEKGAVCLNILRADWKPVLTMKAVIYGLELLFIEPNPDDPLNREAAKQLREDKRGFERQVQRWLSGNYY